MAKLNGVKTIDMVNGEITKVAYNGAVYVKTEQHPQVGDVMLQTTAHTFGDVTKDAFYEVIGFDRDNDPEFIDDVNALNAIDIAYEGDAKNLFYRKQSAQETPTIETVNAKVDGLAERVTALEGAEVEAEHAPLKEATLKIGDYAKVVRENFEHRVGDLLRITGDRNNSDASAFDFKVDRIGKDKNGFIDAKNIVKATDEEVATAKAQEKADAIKRKRDAIFTSNGRKPNEYRKGDIVRITNYQCGHAEGSVVEVTVGTETTDTMVVEGDSKSGFTTFGADVESVEPIVFVENRLDRN